eukprot:6672550-Heterocapsa_arctica.AAC.1
MSSCPATAALPCIAEATHLAGRGMPGGRGVCTSSRDRTHPEDCLCCTAGRLARTRGTTYTASPSRSASCRG